MLTCIIILGLIIGAVVFGILLDLGDERRVPPEDREPPKRKSGTESRGPG